MYGRDCTVAVGILSTIGAMSCFGVASLEDRGLLDSAEEGTEDVGRVSCDRRGKGEGRRGVFVPTILSSECLGRDVTSSLLPPTYVSQPSSVQEAFRNLPVFDKLIVFVPPLKVAIAQEDLICHHLAPQCRHLP